MNLVAESFTINGSMVEQNWNYTSSFPSASEKQIIRRDVLDTISEIFTSKTQIVFLEGDSGIGATSTLAQFVEENEQYTFSIFLNPASRHSYGLEYVKLKIAEQLKLFLDGLPFDKGAIDEAEYSTLLNRTRAKLKGKSGYFVIDGLEHISIEDDSYVATLLSLAFPIGMEGFRFLISGSSERLAKYINRVGHKPYQLKRFTPTEVAELFSDFELEESDLDELKHLCKGNPGRLSAVRRQLKSGASINEVFRISPEKYLDFIALDFTNFSELSENQKKITAVLAFSKQEVSRGEVASIASVTDEEILEILTLCTFLELRQSDQIDFISSAHRKYAEDQLKDWQLIVTDLQIEHLRKEPVSDTALLFLPNYLQQRNKNLELVQLISNDHYFSLLDSTQSLTQLRERADLGLASAHAINNALSIFQFSLQKSLFIDLAESNASRAEIDALVAMGKTHYAMHLIGKAVTKLAKLSLLSAYAGGLKRRDKNVDPFLLDQIVELIKNIDFCEGGDTEIQIAEDLLSVDVNLASDVLEQCLTNVQSIREKDLAFSRLSLVASLGQQNFISNNFEEKIKTKAVQEFTSALMHFHKDKSSEEIIKFIDGAEVKNKIRLLITFISNQRDRDGLHLLIDYSLDLIVKDASFMPKAKDYADLAHPLRHQIISNEILASIINRFNGQIGLVKSSSVTRDWVRLNTSLAYAESKYDADLAFDRILESYYEVCGQSNYEIQSECYARLSYALRHIDPDGKYEAKEGLKAVIDEGWKNAVEQLLKNAASQFECIESILPAIIENDLEESIALVGRLNTEINRNSGYSRIAELLVERPSSPQSISIFNCVLGKFSDCHILSDVLLSCTKSLWRREFDLGWGECLILAVKRLKDYAAITKCKVNIFKSFANSNQALDPEFLIDSVNLFLQKTNASAGRNDICFAAVEALAVCSPEQADSIYQKTIEDRGTIEYESQSVQTNFTHCLSLVTRAFGAALKSNALDDLMLSRLSNAIGRLTSAKHQMSLFTDLACRAWIADNTFKKIVTDHCRPLLESTRKNNDNLYLELLEIAFPALYVAHAESALKELAALSDASQNAALYNTTELIRRRLTRYDPLPADSAEAYLIDSYQASDILSLIERMTFDTAIYWTIDKLAWSIINKKNKHRFTQLQKKDLSERIINIATSALPDKRNILHEGYLICTTARAYMLTDTALPIWKALIERAEKIPNVADQAYVFIQLYRSMPGKFTEDRKALLDKAEASTEEIPSLKDKLGRFELYSLACKDINLPAAKRVLKKSVTMSHQLENIEDAAEVQKSLIDAADQIEPGYADTLLELFDDDPARAFAKAQAKHSIEVNKAKKTLADSNGSIGSKPVADEYLPEAAWKSLSALLCNRIMPKQLSSMAKLMSTSSKLGLTDTYPFLSWYIENAARKYVSTSDVKAQILPLCEVLLLSTELALSVVTRKVDTSAKALVSDVQQQGFIVRPGSRIAALAYIQNWLNQNCNDYIKFSDPYFTADDLELLQMIQAANDSCKIFVLASDAYLKKNNCASSDDFEEAWKELSDQSPPEANILGIGKSNGDELIHDRWLITKNGGLRIGTSINSIGNKLSEISVMSDQEVIACEEALDLFLQDRVHVDGNRVKVTRYQL
ncbi:hypothetical protein KW841_06705 [Pseudomonas sp. PDM28]|uniref:hypothetical protein n=1 Tax=Pseudomonas sp. PDM28 TaxID=2854770 RepID=UPI001C449A60|nr:hypothetical protein [Pseudomonas sp. PDM28]MBV7552039.1 hypothetical protein [Pseudomonas sp. PDM28]